MQRFASALECRLFFALQPGDLMIVNRDGCLAASDGAVSEQAIPGRSNTPSLAKNIPDPVVRSTSLSHGCQRQQFSYLATPYSGYPTRPVSYDPLSRFLEPQQVGPTTIPSFVVRC